MMEKVKNYSVVVNVTDDGNGFDVQVHGELSLAELHFIFNKLAENYEKDLNDDTFFHVHTTRLPVAPNEELEKEILSIDAVGNETIKATDAAELNIQADGKEVLTMHKDGTTELKGNYVSGVDFAGTYTKAEEDK